MASFVQIIVSARNQTAAGFNAVRGSFSRLLANMRVAWNRNLNQFASRGGFGPMMNRISGIFQSAGRTAGQFFINNFRTIAMSGAAAAAAPIAGVIVGALASALAAGILLAVGGGVIAAGIKAAMNAPPVKAAFDSFKKRTKEAFKDFGGPFQGPLVRAADTFASALERMAPTINEMGRMAAPWIDKLAPAFAQMAEKALPGIREALEASAPLFDKIAEHAPQLGEAISKFFQKVADAGPQATEVLGFLLDAIEFIIEALGHAIYWGAQFYSKMIGFWTGVKDFAVTAFTAITRTILSFFGMVINGAASAFSWVPGLGPKLNKAAEDFNRFAAKVNAALDAIQDETVNITYRAVRIGPHMVSGSQLSSTYSSGIGGRAAGGVGAGMTWTGEHGPELVDWRQGRIYNAQQSRRMAAQMGGGGSGAVQVSIGVSAARGAAGNPLVEAMLELLRTNKIRLNVSGSRVVAA